MSLGQLTLKKYNYYDERQVTMRKQWFEKETEQFYKGKDHGEQLKRYGLISG